MTYESVDKLKSVVDAFESGTIAREKWGHPEHLIVAYFFCCLESTPEAAYKRMRSGIHNLLSAFKIDASIEMPYHETLTVFWIASVAEFVRLNPDLSPVDAVSRMISEFGKDYPLRFYSREMLFSDSARKEFVPPDLAGVNWTRPVWEKQE